MIAFRHTLAAACAIAAVLGGASPTTAQSLDLRGPDGRTSTVSAGDWAGLERHQVTLAAHGASRVYEGPLLIDILRLAGLASAGPLRGADLSRAVLVRASDGYAVTYGLGELDPATRAASVILADRASGRPLTSEDGPLRLVVDGDVRPARSARQVVSIEVLDLAPQAARLSEHRH